jgi:hypothetical protein
VVEELMTANRSPTHSPTRSPTRLPTASEWGSAFTIDFTTGLLDAAVTASGATNGTRINSSGVLVAGTAPRFDYTAAGVSRGILCQEARTNYCLNNADISAGSWQVSAVAQSINTTAAPDGNTAADTITCSAGSAAHTIYQIITATSGAYTASVYVKKGTHRYVLLTYNAAAEDFISAVFDLDGGGSAATETDVGTTSGAISGTTMTSAGNGWFRLTLSGTVAGTTKTFSFGFAPAATGNTFTTFGNITFNGAGTETVYLWGPQQEPGSYATSLIVTAGATVTRTADVLKFTPPASVSNIRFTYSDDTTADVSVTPSVEYTIPTGQLGIKTIVGI